MDPLCRVARTAVFRTSDGKNFEVLIGTQESGEYELPGGHIQPGESDAQAAARELREETGIDLSADQLVRAAELPDDRGVPNVIFATSVPTTYETRAGDDVRSLRWVHVDRLNTIGMEDTSRVRAAFRQLYGMTESSTYSMNAAQAIVDALLEGRMKDAEIDRMNQEPPKDEKDPRLKGKKCAKCKKEKCSCDEASFLSKAQQLVNRGFDAFKTPSSTYDPTRKGVGARPSPEDWAHKFGQARHDREMSRGRILIHIGKRGWHISRAEAESLKDQLDRALGGSEDFGQHEQEPHGEPSADLGSAAA